MKETIYLETSVVSYYTSRPSRDVIILAHQEITREWWDKVVKKFDIFISEIVIEEASMGDSKLAQRRLKELEGFKYLELNKRVEEVAEIYLKRLDIPEKSFRDATHLAVACVHNIDYLVTWNCTHLANAEVIKKLLKLNKKYNINTPVICTPEYLLEV